MKSLCTKVCAYEEGTSVCRGCGRTSDEITEWFYASDDRKKEIVKEVKRRKQSMLKDYIVCKYLLGSVHPHEYIMKFASFEECEQWCRDNSNETVTWSAWRP